MASRPDRAAVILAVPPAIAAAVFTAIGIACDLLWAAVPAVIDAALAAAALRAFWHVPAGDDLMAVADATRERQWPALPAKWTAQDWADLEREVKGPAQ